MKICSTFSYLFGGLRKLSIPVFPTIVYPWKYLPYIVDYILSYGDFGLITLYAGSSFRCRSWICYCKLYGLQIWGNKTAKISVTHPFLISWYFHGINLHLIVSQGQGFMVGVQINPVPGLPAGFPVMFINSL